MIMGLDNNRGTRSSKVKAHLPSRDLQIKQSSGLNSNPNYRTKQPLLLEEFKKTWQVQGNFKSTNTENAVLTLCNP